MAKKTIENSDSVDQAIKARSRARRKQASEQARAQGLAHAPRNDLSPRLKHADIAIARLKPDKRRLHKVKESHIASIMASVQTFGVSRPILVDGDLHIVDGHDVVEAARRLGLSTLPCVIIDHLNAAELRLFKIAINRLPQNAEWDFDTLKIEFEALQLEATPLEITGFSAPLIDQILQLDDDSAPETVCLEPERKAPAVTRMGDLWRLGEHRLLCGDALDTRSYARLMGEERARLVLTDMPYNVKIKGHVTSGDHAEFKMASGEMSDEEFAQFTRSWMVEAARWASAGSLLATFIDWRGLGVVLSQGEALGFELINIIVWAKTNAGMGSLWRSAHEDLPVFKIDAAPHINNVELGRHGRWRSNVWTAAGASSLGSEARSKLKLHPTVKPVILLEEMLLDVTRRGEVVLDPFMGSGSAIIAAEVSGRDAFGLELDEAYVDVAVRRWQAHTGRHAVLDETGERFDEVQRRRDRGEPELKRLPAPTRALPAPASSEG